jgi:hypothetical protein
MKAAIAMAREHGGFLIRLPGGYWTYLDCPRSRGAGPPDQYFGTTTIEGLVARKRMHYSQWQRRSKRHGQFPIEVELVEDAA